MSGTPVFGGTRVPIQSLWDHLEAGDNLDKFFRRCPADRPRKCLSLPMNFL